jgi:hypothetical protein
LRLGITNSWKSRWPMQTRKPQMKSGAKSLRTLTPAASTGKTSLALSMWESVKSAAATVTNGITSLSR